MNIEEIWPDNAYRGLWGEVVEADIYRIRQLKFVPDTVFDIGANVGTFSKFAHELWPDSKIVAVEPDESNVANLKYFNGIEKIILYNAAIGNGEVYRDKKAVNGSHECYLSSFLGYEDISENGTIEKTKVVSLTLADIGSQLNDGQKYIVKIDIEGAETAIFQHEPSMQFLRNANYFAMELHYFAMTPNGVLQVRELTEKALESFKETHDTVYEHPMFYATKKI